MLKTEKDLVDSKKNTTFTLTNNNLKRKENRIMWFGIFILFCLVIIIVDEAKSKHKSIDELKKAIKDKFDSVEE
jgi:hypothetical protein